MAAEFLADGAREDQPKGEFAARVMRRISAIVETGDWSGVEYSNDDIVELLERFNYVKSEWVVPEDQETQVTTVDRARAFVAGQVISALVRPDVGMLNPKVNIYIERHRLDTDVQELRRKGDEKL